ncbi:MAG: hypothetical protein IJU76_00240 [Desulfovibrionaceae bacterium]|nr:hypothetical protein [Desulfovibrionaceae bacterium]
MRLQITLSSIVLLRPVHITVALPDGFSKARPPYRTVWALHSAMSDGDMFFSVLGMEEFVQKEGFALVAPSLGNGYFINGSHERQADFLQTELLPTLRETLPLSTDRRDNVLLGISMGAYGAIHWALNSPETFSRVSALSGVFERPLPEHPLLRKKRALKALYGALSPIMRQLFEDKAGVIRSEADLQPMLERLNERNTPSAWPQIRLFCGEEDYLALPHCQNMLERLCSCNGWGTLYIAQGGHDAVFWRSILTEVVQTAFADNNE